MDPRTFEEAVNLSRSLPPQPPTMLLELYSLYKQATMGDVQGSRPSILEMRERAKWDAWAAKKGMSTESARVTYVALVEELYTDQER